MEIRDKSKVNLCFQAPSYLRKELSRPYGILFTKTNSLIDYISKKKRIISVGDVVTEVLIQNNIIPFLSIIDGKTKRIIKTKESIKPTYYIKNEPGILRIESIDLINRVLMSTSSSVVFVDGEEDLFVVPLVLAGEKGDLVVYGQPNAGAVVLEVCETTKWRVNDIFKKFQLKNC